MSQARMDGLETRRMLAGFDDLLALSGDYGGSASENLNPDASYGTTYTVDEYGGLKITIKQPSFSFSEATVDLTIRRKGSLVKVIAKNNYSNQGYTSIGA